MIQAGQIATILEAFTPKMYYEVDILKMPEIHYVSWVMLSVCIFIAAVSRKIEIKSTAVRYIISVLCAAATILAYIYLDGVFKSEGRTRIHRLEQLATNEDWDEIIRLHGKDIRSRNEANYLNLALAEKGRLAEDLFKYKQDGPASLINDVKAQNDIDLLRLSRVLFAMGNMGAAQDMAFDADQAFGDHAPSMLRMLTEIDLKVRESIFKGFPVAGIGVHDSEQVIHRVRVQHKSVLALHVAPAVSENPVISHSLVIM